MLSYSGAFYCIAAFEAFDYRIDRNSRDRPDDKGLTTISSLFLGDLRGHFIQGRFIAIRKENLYCPFTTSIQE